MPVVEDAARPSETTGQPDADGPLAFFQAQHDAFVATLRAARGAPNFLDRLWMQAFSSFEHNVEEQTRTLPQLACHKGCGTCCQLLVVATAPEVLMVTRYLRATGEGFRKMGIDLDARLSETAEAPEAARSGSRPMALIRSCPFLVEGICVIYPVRPMACRGHASFNEEACISALKGGSDNVPVSEPHRTVRALVQNALQSALRDEGYPWDLYDLVAALKISLARPDGEAAFAAGEDFLAPALVRHVSREEMASTFDRLKA